MFRRHQTNILSVSSIIESRGWLRKLIKTIILLFTVAGFLLQTLEFLQLYWQYSTMTLTKGMSKIKKPALTICDENLFRRKILCESGAKGCYDHYRELNSEAQICLMLEEYCLDPNDIYLLENYIWHERIPDEYYDINFTRRFGFESEKNILECKWISNATQSNSPSTSCGKTEFVRVINTEKIPGACYTIKPSLHMLDDDLQRDTVLRMVVRWHTSDLIRKASTQSSGGTTFRYYWIAFHLPGKAANPFFEGIRIKEGNRYHITVSQVDTIRLPPPHSTNCFDYVNEWKKNRFEGPLGREDCQATCEINATFQAFGCVGRDIVYPHDKKLCVLHKSFDHDLNVEIQKCMESCRDACKDTDYAAQVKIEDAIDLQTSLEKYEAANVAFLDVSFDILKSVTIEHKPIYESVELFSYIGGYLGIWIGWSLLGLFDFFFNFCLYPYIRRKKPKRKNRRNLSVIYHSEII